VTDAIECTNGAIGIGPGKSVARPRVSSTVFHCYELKLYWDCKGVARSCNLHWVFVVYYFLNNGTGTVELTMVNCSRWNAFGGIVQEKYLFFPI
jgi:hypothetical protein